MLSVDLARYNHDSRVLGAGLAISELHMTMCRENKTEKVARFKGFQSVPTKDEKVRRHFTCEGSC